MQLIEWYTDSTDCSCKEDNRFSLSFAKVLNI